MCLLQCRLIIKYLCVILFVLVLQPKRLANTVRHYKQSIIFITSKHFNKTNSFINAGVQWTPLLVCGIYKICFGIQFLPLPTVARLSQQINNNFHIQKQSGNNAFHFANCLPDHNFPFSIFHFPFLIKQKQPTALQSTV